MPSVIFIEESGRQHRVEVPVGASLMRGAIASNVRGIDAECGGQCVCATCHIVVDESWIAKTGRVAASSQEAGMLALVENSEPNSRLACQIKMSTDLDGLIVRVVPSGGQCAEG